MNPEFVNGSKRITFNSNLPAVLIGSKMATFPIGSPLGLVQVILFFISVILGFLVAIPVGVTYVSISYERVMYREFTGCFVLVKLPLQHVQFVSVLKRPLRLRRSGRLSPAQVYYIDAEEPNHLTKYAMCNS